MILRIVLAALALASSSLVVAQTPTPAPVYCSGATGHVLIGAAPAYVECPNTPPEPPVCPPAPVCPVCPTCPPVPPVTCPPGQHVEAGVCVPDPTPPASGINTCLATQLSTSFNGVTLQRQCTGNVTFYQNYHAPYPGPNLFRLDVALADALHPGPFADLISGYTMLITIGTGHYVSLGFNATIAGQMQFTADPSGGDAGMISVSRRPGVFLASDPDLVVSPVYGPCLYNYGASNSLWIGMGADCPLEQGKDYYVNWAIVDVNGAPYGIGKISYSEVSGH